MSHALLDADISPGEELLFDSSALIAYFGSEPTTPVISHIIDEYVGLGRNTGAVCAVSVMEIGVGPLRGVSLSGSGSGPDAAARAALAPITDFLTGFRGIRVLDVDYLSAINAAMLRANQKLSPPDALIVGCAARHRVRQLVTNDRRWLGRLTLRGFTVRLLSDYLPFV